MMRKRIWPLVLLCALFLAPLQAAASTVPLNGEQVLAMIRKQFRSHPTPPFVSYTLKRTQLTEDGSPDFEWSYTYHVWCRTSDGAALARKIWNGRAGDLEFKRYAFNRPEDPGPPTSDLFEPASWHAGATAQISGEQAPVIADVKAVGDTDYHIRSLAIEGSLLHLTLEPILDPDRTRLREIYAEPATYELRKIVGTDRLFILGGPVYDQLDTMTMGEVAGVPVITAIHSSVQNERIGFFEADFTFTDIAFPRTLPAWYFEPRTYGAHAAEAPT